ncbi:hypothetical protein [Brunnivagina elsteri]|uniref:hypothetical protein n=1 Tax=Brunnivagina elsteri TaxID=1247191 RepID=UPI00130428D8|nr:hypothetical protein [Calothrix elsteri]
MPCAFGFGTQLNFGEAAPEELVIACGFGGSAIGFWWMCDMPLALSSAYRNQTTR